MTIETGHINMSPSGFLFYAADFLNAYKSYKLQENSFSPASYYLLCRSLELSLKGFLLAKSVTRDKLKSDIGHNLHKILNKAIKLEINLISPISKKQEQEIQKANGWYNRKGFEYFEIQNICDKKETLPDLSVLAELSDQLVLDLKPFCLSVA